MIINKKKRSIAEKLNRESGERIQRLFGGEVRMLLIELK